MSREVSSIPPGKVVPLSMATAYLWLVLSRHMPLEEAIGGNIGTLWLIAKCSLTFLSLLPMLMGWGLLALVSLSKLAQVITGTKASPCQVRELGLWTSSSLLLGVGVAGLLTFGVGIFWPPSWATTLPVVTAGYLLTALAWRGNWLAWRAAWPQLSAYSSKDVAGGTKRWLWFLFAIVALRCSSVYFFQGHEDAYIYHLSAAESWLQRGQTGVFVTNIYTGYALAVEHYYLLLKIVAVGNAEQNALAQISHLVCGYGTFIWAMLTLSSRWLNRREQAACVLVFMHTWLAFFMLLPKNDGYLAGATAMALIGLAEAMPFMFLAGASVAMIMKPTAGLTFAAMGVADLLTRPSLGGSQGRAVWTHLKVLGTGAMLMIAVWAPFGWRNAVVTGNPFFPLISEVFHTPYAPELSRVIMEAQPFKLNPVSLIRSLARLLTSDIAIIAGIFAVVIIIAKRRSDAVLKPFMSGPATKFVLVFAATAFVILQLFCGEFGQAVESRHFLSVLGPLMILGIALLVQAAPPSQRLKVTPVVIALMGILFSNFDVSLRDLYRGLSNGGVTSSFMQRKPNMFLNQYVSKLIAAKSPDQSTASVKPRVFATTECNAEYFLSNAEFWHGKKTYPAWTWDSDKLSGPELTQKLIESNISYAITDGGSPLALSLSATAGATLVSRAGPLELWQVR